MSASDEASTVAGLALHLRDLRHAFDLGEGRTVPALQLDALDVRQGERLALRGPNGSGKTTLLHVIAGLLRPSAGIVEVERVPIYALGASARDRFRARQVGYLFQSFFLLEPLTALENVLCAAAFARVHPRRERGERAKAILDHFGLGDRLDHRPSQLSTGQQQRVAAARALVNDPGIVLCDEPTANLDEASARLLLDDLALLCAGRGATLIVASHDPEILSAFPVFDLHPAGGRP